MRLRKETARALQTLQEKPGMTLREFAERDGVSLANAVARMKTLRKHGLVDVEDVRVVNHDAPRGGVGWAHGHYVNTAGERALVAYAADLPKLPKPKAKKHTPPRGATSVFDLGRTL